MCMGKRGGERDCEIERKLSGETISFVEVFSAISAGPKDLR